MREIYWPTFSIKSIAIYSLILRGKSMPAIILLTKFLISSSVIAILCNYLTLVKSFTSIFISFTLISNILWIYDLILAISKSLSSDDKEESDEIDI